MAKSALRVLMLHNIVAPYRLPIFEEINRHLNLTVFFSKAKTADRKWSTKLDGYSFTWRILPDVAIGPFFLNLTLPWRLLRERFDVYLVGDFPEMAFATFVTILVAKLRRKPVVLWSETIDHDVIYFQHLAISNKRRHRAFLRLLTWLITGYRRFLLRLPNRFVALSGMAEVFLLSEGVDPKQIHSGIQVMPKELLDTPTASKAASPYRDQRVVLYLGYFNPLKGIDILIRAFGQMNDPQARLVIVGAGPEEAALKRLAARDARVEFYGYTEGSDRANLLHWADVLVLPTLADCWAFVVNESLYYGTPVITTSAAGASELLRDGQAGLIVPPRDEPALAAAIQQILGDEQLHREMTEATQAARDRITDRRVGARPIIKALQATARPTRGGVK